MDLTGQFEHPQFIKTMETILEKSRYHAIPMGLHIVQPDTNVLASKIAEGYQFIADAIDTVFYISPQKDPSFHKS